MNKILGTKISKEVERLVKDRVSITNEPYTFLIKGVTGHGYDLYTTAHISFNKIKKWAEREGAQVTLIHDEYKRLVDDNLKNIEHLPLEYRLYKERKTSSKNQSNGYLKIEVTDPAARIMEHVIQN